MVFPILSTLFTSDLKKPARQWFKSAGKDDLIVTSEGQPVAVLMCIASVSVEFPQAPLCSARALQAQAAFQQTAAASSASGLSPSNLDADIVACRRARWR